MSLTHENTSPVTGLPDPVPVPGVPCLLVRHPLRHLRALHVKRGGQGMAPEGRSLAENKNIDILVKGFFSFPERLNPGFCSH